MMFRAMECIASVLFSVKVVAIVVTSYSVWLTVVITRTKT